MPRIAIVGLACSTFLILLSSSAVPQEARAGADTGSGQLIFNNACRTCHTTKEGDDLRLFQRYERRGFRVEQGEARRLHRETR
jgi:cytochrome c5